MKARVCFTALAALCFVATATAQPANFSDVVPPIHGSVPDAPGDVINQFAIGWAAAPIGVAFDYMSGSENWFFHESDPASGIWIVDQGGTVANPFTYTKLGGQNTDGGSIRPGDGFIYASDFNGDLVTIDDNIYLFDRTGATVAFWETDVGINGPACTGGSTDQIIDVAVDHGDGCTVYATSNVDNLIHEIDLCDTSGGAGANSPCNQVATHAVPGTLLNVVAIEYDSCNDGYWLADFGSNNVVLVDNDGTFSTVLASFNGDGGAGFNTGVTPWVDGSDPLPLFTTDFSTLNATEFDSGTTGCGACIFRFAPIVARREEERVRIRYQFIIEHNRASVQVPLNFWVRDNAGKVHAAGTAGIVTLEKGERMVFKGVLTAPPDLPPGTYRFVARIDGMNGFWQKITSFQID